MTNNELKKKRFELHIDPKPSMDEYCIVDTEQEALTIYNNLGCIYFTSAPALCDLLNELDAENNILHNEQDKRFKIISILSDLEDGDYPNGWQREDLLTALDKIADIVGWQTELLGE